MAPQPTLTAEPSVDPQKAKVVAEQLARTATLRGVSGTDLTFDKALLLPDGAIVDADAMPKTNRWFSHVQVGTKGGQPVFLDVGLKMDTGLSTATADAIALGVTQGNPEVQSCTGKRTCVRICEKEGKEECCEWRCK